MEELKTSTYGRSGFALGRTVLMLSVVGPCITVATVVFGHFYPIQIDDPMDSNKGGFGR
jgi:hypothetical protein